MLIGFDGNSYNEKQIAEYAEDMDIEIDCAFFPKDFVDKRKESLCELLGAEHILTSDGACAVLYDRVTVSKENGNFIVDTDGIKTEIFYEEYLQDEEKYDTIYFNDGKYIFPFGDKNTYNLNVIT